MKRFLIAFAAVVGGLGVNCGRAQFIWTGAGANLNINNPANWQGGVAPSGLATDTLIFPKSVQGVAFFNASQTVGNIIYTGQNGTSWLMGINPAVVVTLAGDISSSPSFSFYGSMSATLALTSAPHTMNIEGSYVYLMGDVSGAGSLVKTGGATLGLKGTNTFSGGVTINQGTVLAGSNTALGTGTVTFNSGVLSSDYDVSVTIGNNFLLGANPTFSSYSYSGTSLTLTGEIKAINATSNLNVIGDTPLQLTGNIVNSTLGATSYTFSGGGTVILAGNNTYTGGTTIGTETSGSQVYFATGNSIPAAGTIKTSDLGYAGLVVPTAVGTFLSRLDPVGFTGVLGFDTLAGGTQTFASAINLSALPDTVRIGTATDAILTGEITPRTATAPYNFSGAGWLYLRDGAQSYPLTGTRDLRASTFDGATNASDPFMLIVSRSGNTYTGDTIASRGGIIFDATNAIPPTGAFHLTAAGSYIGHTETSSATVANLVSRLASGSYSPESVLGFDSHDYINGVAEPMTRTVSDINLGSLTNPIFIGTASAAIINGPITTTSGGNADYFFAGYAGGSLTVNTTLSGTGRKVWVGLPTDIPANDFSQVSLTQNNTYTGGTILSAGTLHADLPNSLGTGPLSVEPWSQSVILSTGSSVTTLGNNIILQYGDLRLYPTSPSGLTLSGTISGEGRLLHSTGNLTLPNANPFSGGMDVTGQSTTVLANANTALGTGLIYLNEAASLNFSTSAPIVGGLGGGDPYDNDGFHYSSVVLIPNATLTINQPWNETFAGNIQGAGAIVVKTGPGSLELKGNSTYSGGTQVLQGTLIAGSNTALGSGNIVVNGGTIGAGSGVVLNTPITFGLSGGRLGGSGTIGGNFSVGPAIGLAPGASPGTLTFTGSLTWMPSGSYDLEVVSATGGVPGTSYDTIVVTNTGAFAITANSGARFNLNLLSLSDPYTPGNIVDFNSGAGYSWQIASSTNGITGFTAGAFNLNTTGTGSFTNALNAGLFSVSLGTAGGNPFTGNTAIFLNFTPVPEPSTWALLLSGLGALVVARRRRR